MIGGLYPLCLVSSGGVTSRADATAGAAGKVNHRECGAVAEYALLVHLMAGVASSA
jgi:hypothetical protein